MTERDGSTLQSEWAKLLDGQPRVSGENVDKVKRVWLDGAQAMLLAISKLTPNGLADEQLRKAIALLNDEVMGEISQIHKKTN